MVDNYYTRDEYFLRGRLIEIRKILYTIVEIKHTKIRYNNNNIDLKFIIHNVHRDTSSVGYITIQSIYNS